MDEIEVLILAGGLGTRLSTVVSDVPKPMAQVGGIPFLEILTKRLIQEKFYNFNFLVGHKKEVIQDHFGDGSRYNAVIKYAVEEAPLGTGGALKNALKFTKSEKFLILNGDTFFNLSFADFVKKANDFPSVALCCVENGYRYGSVEVDNENFVTSFVEKGGASGPCKINGGVYYMPRSVIEKAPEEKHSFETLTLPSLVKERKLKAFSYNEKFIDIGIPEDYSLAQTYLKEYFDRYKG